MPTTNTTRQHGFTAIEIIVVIAIIGILAAVAIPEFKRHCATKRTDPTSRAAAVQLAERSGLRNAEVVAEHRTRNMTDRDKWQVGCLADGDVVLELEGLDAKEQRTRMIVCCRPASTGTICALPPPSRALPLER